MIFFLVLIFVFITKEALAQPAYCVDPTTSWGHQYRVGSVQSVLYYKDLLLFSTVIVPGKISNLHIHTKVPLNVATKFQTLTDATAAYNSSIKNKYLQIILAETGCPMLNEDSDYLLNGPGNTSLKVLSTGNTDFCLSSGGTDVSAPDVFYCLAIGQ